MKNTKLIAITGCLALAATSANALIDFESYGTDDQVIDSNFKFVDGSVEVQFGIDIDGIYSTFEDEAFIEEVGTENADDGFWYNTGGAFDTESPNAAPDTLGNYFLRTSALSASEFGEGGTLPGVFLIKYTGAGARAASGQIWDVDGDPFAGGSEAWKITAYDAGQNILAIDNTLEYFNNDENTSLDGQAYTFIFDNLTADLAYITIEFTGSKTSGIGLAFDNFSADVIPEPSTYAAIFGALALGLAVYRRKLRK